QMLLMVLELLVQEHEQNLEQLKVYARDLEWDKAGSVAHKMITGFKQLKADTVIPHLAILEDALHLPEVDDNALTEAAILTEANALQVLAALKQEVESIKQQTSQTVENTV
ncbi:MAG: hypothetical protein LPK03_05210, partial [Pontibacter sp.]|nr:hypothetical protein [Pontibacter sp.]